MFQKNYFFSWWNEWNRSFNTNDFIILSDSQALQTDILLIF
ncbi:hypothetical protein BTN50_1103 [Candidatus Enterovibrio altilux]|uniref:Uncharacterized protein n=1 Tax=Candidatus Enterovibrio altilux TaxID=1927128 RepID=A0A291B9D4_9GAMM|nr:hypothetical protein BTN50_1103 [Candidatus Enterovibrio luxaltus]